MPARTQPEITARPRQIRDADTGLFGFREDVLLPALDFDHAREFLDPSVRREDWRQQSDHESHARAYLVFAIRKIIDRRSNSASRSVAKLAELARLLGRDDVAAAMDAAPYPMYGAPKLKAFADVLGWRFADSVDDPDSRQALIRMAQGQQCQPDGCQ
jgi:hypothetical protein